jgi:hypothetical protein
MEHKKLEFCITQKSIDNYINSSYGEIIELSPIEFLSLAVLDGGYNKELKKFEMWIDFGDSYETNTVKYLMHKIKSGYCFPIPMLRICQNDREFLQVTTHEGRHRMMAAYYLNIDKVKVGIEHRIEDINKDCRIAQHRSQWKPIQNIDFISPESNITRLVNAYGKLSRVEWSNIIYSILERNKWRFEGVDLEDFTIDKDSSYERR